MSVLSGKELKKWRKIKLRLEKEGLSLSSTGTCNVAVANGGIGNGVNIKDLLEKVKEFGNPEKYISLPNKSYAEITFSSSEEAERVVSKLQGCQINKTGANNVATLYFYYLTTLSNSGKANVREAGFPDGLILLEEFISEDEEQELLGNIFRAPQSCRETLKHRTVFHYGHKFRYGSNDVDLTTPDSDLPSFCDVIIARMLGTGHMSERPDQLTVNVYEPGEGIPLHRDNVVAFGGCLATLSLGSQVAMEMRRGSEDKAEVLLKRRTLALFTGESRYGWEHGIRQRRTDVVSENGNTVLLERGRRVSLTFRKVTRSSVLPSNLKEAETLELQHVHHVYDNIAAHFSSTREKPWPKVVQFLDGLTPGSFVLDVGCGSGRYLGVSPDVVCLGCDRSRPLLENCSKGNNPRGVSHASFACDGQNLPIRSRSFDACICIAVIHHFSTNQRRVAAIEELLRVVATGGRLLIYVWAVEQRFNETKSKYLKKNLPEDKNIKSESLDFKTEDKVPNDDESGTIEDKVPNDDESGTIVDKVPNDDESGKIKGVSNEPTIIEDKGIAIHTNRTPFAQQDLFVPWKKKEDSTFLRFYHVFVQHELEDMCRGIPCCRIIRSYHDNGNWAVVLEKK